MAAWIPPRLSTASPAEAHFQLHANPAFVNCLARFPGSSTHPPRAEVTVVRGELNDLAIIRIHNIKPGLNFDLFTVQRSSLLSDGTPDPDFVPVFKGSFGLAWYQTDLKADRDGDNDFGVIIKTILLDQIFGFDPDVSLPPTNTFHVGFWFNDPNDAAPCGFDVTKPTPFNGEHKAGPLAMISVPDATTNLGPLCTNPDTSTTPATCNP